MRKSTYILSFIMAMAASVCTAQVDIAKADNLFNTNSNINECLIYLESILPQAASGKEKAEVLWRMSRACLIKGQNAESKEQKREIFGKGISYAQDAIKEDPKNPECYMWHSGNVGRECQTRNFTEQAKKLSVIMDDLTMILDKMKKTDYSSAWQAMAEIYYNHPFKSNDDAINFARKAVMCIPNGELRISTYTLLAKLLYERGMDASKRNAEISSNSGKFKASYSSVIDKYAYFDGSLGNTYKPVWSEKTLGEMSDKEEAKAIAAYAKALYSKAGSRSGFDKADYNELTALSKQW